MRIRKVLVEGVFVAVAIASIPLPAISAPNIIPGSSCKVLNQKIVSQKKSYTCIKSGKKLIWSKGIEAMKPGPTPTPAPAPTPAPTPTPTPAPTPAPTQNLTAEDIKNLAILEKSWSQINNLQISQESGRIIFLVDPQFPIESRDAIKKGIELTVGKFDSMFKVRKPIFAILSTSLDFELAQYKKYSLMQQNFEAEAQSNPILGQWRIDQYKQIDSGFKKFASGGTMPLYDGVKEPAGYYMYFRMHPENQDKTSILMGAHETGHLVHWQVNSDFPQTQPAWWIEGQAQMIGESVAAQAGTFAEFERFLKSQTSPDYGGGFFSGTTKLAELEGDSLTRSEFNCALCRTRLVYSRGKVAIHYLVGKYGIDKVMAFTATLSRTNRWWQSFEKTFGVSVEDFYAEYDSYAQWFADYFSPGWRKSQF